VSVCYRCFPHYRVLCSAFHPTDAHDRAAASVLFLPSPSTTAVQIYWLATSCLREQRMQVRHHFRHLSSFCSLTVYCKALLVSQGGRNGRFDGTRHIFGKIFSVYSYTWHLVSPVVIWAGRLPIYNEIDNVFVYLRCYFKPVGYASLRSLQ
jgi:hypothetical protein